MTRLHEELCKGGKFEDLDFAPYIKNLTQNLFQTYKFANTTISLNMNLEDNLFFDIDTAIPLGMVVNELISNSLKHVFPGRDHGEIQIKLCLEKTEECINRREENKNENCNTTNFIMIIPEDVSRYT
jgi:two-component sensor histidine kinase